MCRPTKYRPKYCKDIVDYYKNGSITTYFPTIAGFCTTIGVNKDTIMEWCSKYPEFSVSFKDAKLYAEQMLADGALKGTYSSNYAKFVAWNYHQMSEKTETVNTNTHLFPQGITVSFIGGKKDESR